jgi:Amt family ammonium transporter
VGSSIEPKLLGGGGHFILSRPARWITGFAVAGLAVLWLGAGEASAQDEVAYLPQQVADETWYLLAGAMVMIMQAGFAMLETGLTRAKNAVNVCTKNLLDFSVGAILYWAIGYSLMYAYPDQVLDAAGNPTVFAWIGGLGQAFKPDVMGLEDGYAASDWFFQMVFCATAATIVSGAMAERTKLVGYIAATVIITAFIYPISAGWGWAGSGWAAVWGVRDFAGSNIVHACGAWCALAGAIIVGPRLGKYNADGSANAIPGHNVILATLGTFILWFGWYGFNCGSMLAQDTGMAFVAVTTTLSAGAGALAALVTSWSVWGKPDTTMGLNGALAGLVGITAPCGSVAPWAAVLIGLIAGVIVFFSVIFIEKVLKVDDPVGAISVHGVCGVWGTLSVGLFGSSVIDTGISDGLFLGGGLAQLGKQATFVGATFVFAFGASLILFAIVKYTIGLRVSDAEQIEGLDLGEHDLAAYPDFQPTNIKSYHLREA